MSHCPSGEGRHKKRVSKQDDDTPPPKNRKRGKKAASTTSSDSNEDSSDGTAERATSSPFSPTTVAKIKEAIGGKSSRKSRKKEQKVKEEEVGKIPQTIVHQYFTSSDYAGVPFALQHAAWPPRAATGGEAAFSRAPEYMGRRGPTYY